MTIISHLRKQSPLLRSRLAGLITIATLVFFAACQEEDEKLDVSFLEEETIVGEPGPIDLWIAENYTTPYNISVDYKWNPYEVPSHKILVPPKEQNVIPAMDIVKKIWIAPYVQQAGEVFMKTHAPKQFVLVGSAQFNNDGTIVLGEAESGRKVTLYVINEFDRTNVPAVKEMLHTIHHEFAHILHQTVLYPREFKQVTPSGYTATWYNTPTQIAWSLGFITPYARASSDEDFVEMISTMLVEGHDGFEAILNATTPEGRALLKKKEAFVVSYFQDVWNIDFYDLQDATVLAIQNATE